MSTGAGSETPAARPATATTAAICCASSCDDTTRLLIFWRPGPVCSIFSPGTSRCRSRSNCSCQGSGRSWVLRMSQVRASRSGPRRSRSASICTQPLSNSVIPSRTAITSTAKPAPGERVGPVGGGGGGSGRRDRRRRMVEVCPLPEPFSSSCGIRIDQRSGRSRLGASRIPSSCLACWRNFGSRQRLSSLQVAMALSSCPWPIQAVIIRSRRPGPSGLLIGCCSARGRSSSRLWP